MFRVLLNCKWKTVSVTATAVKYNNFSCARKVRILNSVNCNFREFYVFSKLMSMGDKSRKSSTESILDTNDKRVTFSENFKDQGKSDGSDGAKFSGLDGDYFDECVDFQSVSLSTVADEQKVIDLLKEILSYQDKNLSSWIVEVS